MPGGDAGIYATLAAMRRLVRRVDHHPVIGQAARDAAGDTTNPLAQWRGLRAWLLRFTRFRTDPAAFDETLFTPVEQFLTLKRDGLLAQDCDDVAMLAAALCRAVGRRVRFVVVGFGAPGAAAPYRHVYTEMQAGRLWLDFDLTRTADAPAATRRATLEV